MPDSGCLKPPAYRYILSFGSNVGDRRENFKNALTYLRPYLRVIRQTKWQETAPLTHRCYNTSDHEIYLNFVCEVVSNCDPQALYRAIYQIENRIGHPRERRWLPRKLDIDILFCVFNNPDKTFSACLPYTTAFFDGVSQFSVPHKEYFNREFLQEMVEGELKIPREFLKNYYTQTYTKNEICHTYQ